MERFPLTIKSHTNRLLYCHCLPSEQVSRIARPVMDVETNLEEEIELEPLIHVQHDIKIPTRLEARTALAQFLALCGSLFLLGWNDGSTGPLLPRIQKVYNVTSLFYQIIVKTPCDEFCRSGLEQCLGYSFWDVRSVMRITS